jgi:hypothetical protein
MNVHKMLFAAPQIHPGLEICQHIRLYAPLASTVKQPQSTTTATTITVATTAAANTTSRHTTSATDTNMTYVLRNKP